MSKWRKIFQSDEKSPDWIVLENVNNRKQIRFLETASGKKKRYESELKSGDSEYSLALGDKYPKHKLTAEEKMYRRGWLSAFRELERINGRGKKR